MRHPVAALVAALSLVSLLAACAAPGPIADPREVVARSVEAVAASRSYHYLATLDGEVPLPPTGSAEAAPLDLGGTTLEGEVDVPGAAATIALEIPGLGPAFDAIVVGPDLWLRAGLLGGEWQRSSAIGNPLAALARPAAILSVLQEAFDALPQPPRKEADRDCGDVRCYAVVIDVSGGSGADLPGLLGGLLGEAFGSDAGDGAGGLGGFGGFGGLSDGSSVGLPDLSAGGVPLPSLDPALAAGGGTAELLVRIDDLRPHSLSLRGATAAAPSMIVMFDRWDEPVRIEAPAP